MTGRPVSWLYEIEPGDPPPPDCTVHWCPADGCTYRLVELTDVDLITPMSVHSGHTYDELVRTAVEASSHYRARTIETVLAAHVDSHDPEDWIRRINALTAELAQAREELDRLRALVTGALRP